MYESQDRGMLIIDIQLQAGDRGEARATDGWNSTHPSTYTVLLYIGSCACISTSDGFVLYRTLYPWLHVLILHTYISGTRNVE